MELKIGRCPICGANHTLLPSNNPLMPPICTACVIKQVDQNNMEQVDSFCRTFNIPFKPELWIKVAKEFKQNAFKEYISLFYDGEKQIYKDTNRDLWKDADKEWKLVRTHEEIIAKIKPIKEGYMLRNQIKWGQNYTFEELIQLESLFTSTLNSNDVSNPMQKDAIKKACKMSVALDRAIVSGDSKEINELSKAYQYFVKTAKIDDLITASSQDVISNVAQLVQFIEDSGFQFQFYDDVDRDVVDKSLKDMQQFIQRLVIDATGLESVFETISAGFKKENAIKKDAESYEKVPLEELYQVGLDERNKAFDEELEREASLFDDDISSEEDEDGFF